MLAKREKSGFTLIELLVVISIIGVLAALGVASYTTAQRQSRDTRRLGDVRAIVTALEQYYTDYGRYPDSTNAVTGCSGVSGNWCCSGAGGGSSDWIKDGFPAYMGGLIPNQLGNLQTHCYYSDTMLYDLNYSMEAKSSNAIGTLAAEEPSTATRYRYSVKSPQ